LAGRIGLVIGNENDGRARIVIDRKAAFGGCHSSGCRSRLSNSRMESPVSNPIGARAGDVVQVSLKSASLLAGAALLYLMPILTLLGGAVFGSMESPTLGWYPRRKRLRRPQVLVGSNRSFHQELPAADLTC
jgi:positive regulator of sigma E activity